MIDISYFLGLIFAIISVGVYILVEKIIEKIKDKKYEKYKNKE